MKRLLFLFLLTELFCTTTIAQTTFVVKCKTFERNDSLKILAPGLIDHSELKTEWVKKEINKDSIEIWLKNYMEKCVIINPDNLDKLELKILEQEQGYIIERWNKIKSLIIDGDKIMYYSTPENYWNSLAGQDGIMIIRKCLIVGVLILSQS